jgi:drug/metabolite transporter (DMT)-like permease
MTATHSHKTGYLFALLAFAIFATQDAISKHLSDLYPPMMITMIRYWAFAGFAIIATSRGKGGLRRGATTRRPFVQIFRGVLLALQIVVSLLAFRAAGLLHSQAIFASTPLMVAVLSVPVLGEPVGWRRWTAIIVGLGGVLIILQPSAEGIDIALLVPLLSSAMNAVYSVTTRLVSRDDSAMTSFFYLGVAGTVVISAIGPFYWTNMAPADWGWTLLLCVTGISSHYCLIKAYDHLDAVLVQPISYFQLVLASFYGVTIFHEALRPNLVIGALIVVGAGLFTIWREASKRKKHEPAVENG